MSLLQYYDKDQEAGSLFKYRGCYEPMIDIHRAFLDAHLFVQSGSSCDRVSWRSHLAQNKIKFENSSLEELCCYT